MLIFNELQNTSLAASQRRCQRHSRILRPARITVRPMFRFDFMLTAMLVLGAIASAIWRAPEGYEDETGFHYRGAAKLQAIRH